MGLFLILSPFATLSAMMVVAPAAVALFTAASVALALVAADAWRGRSLKMRQIGTALLLATVGAYVLVVDRGLSGLSARIAVDAGLLALALISMAARFPFTIQYARETVTAEIAARADFRRANYVITWVWTASFVVMLVADIGTVYAPWLPLWTGVAAAFTAKNAAAYFTRWYTGQRRAKVAAERAGFVNAATVDGGVV